MYEQIKVENLIRQKKFTKAEKEIKKLINKNINENENIILLCFVFMEQNKNSSALAEINKLISKNKKLPDAYLVRGNINVRNRKFQEALKDFDSAIQLNPKYIDAWLNKGNTLCLMREWEVAIGIYEKAEEFSTDQINIIHNKAIALQELKRYSEALALFNRVIQIDPGFADAWLNRGWSLYCLANLTDALKSFEHALLINPANALAWTNKGVVLFDLKRYDESEQSFRKSEAIDKNNPRNLYNLSLLELSTKQFKYGWLTYRNRGCNNQLNSIPLKTSKPEWQGDKSSKTLFVWGEQGIGDQILYASMFGELDRFPQKKIISVNQKLLPIFRRSFPNITFVDKDHFFSEEKYDEQLPLGSLGQYFRSSSESFGNSEFPYLLHDQLKTQAILNKFEKNNTLLCGLSWRSINLEVGDYKSIDLVALKPLLTKNFDFINLQYGNVDNEIQSFENESSIRISKVPDINLFDDIDSVASLIMACDFIVTVSNSTAHIAGALGKKTYLLLPAGRGKFWYWHTQEENNKSLWYPSITILEQEKIGDWTDVLKKLTLLLDEE
jgi:tetratricopeptide (TPR) repeat protein